MPVRGQCGECDGTTHGGGRDQPGPGSLNTFMWWVLRAGREFTKQIGGTSPPRKQDQNARSLKGQSKLHTWMGTLQGVADRRVGAAPGERRGVGVRAHQGRAGGGRSRAPCVRSGPTSWNQQDRAVHIGVVSSGPRERLLRDNADSPRDVFITSSQLAVTRSNSAVHCRRPCVCLLRLDQRVRELPFPPGAPSARKSSPRPALSCQSCVSAQRDARAEGTLSRSGTQRGRDGLALGRQVGGRSAPPVPEIGDPGRFCLWFCPGS